jgi:replicative DNA helicase
MKPVLPCIPESEAAAVACLLFGASPDTVPLREDHFHGTDARIVFTACRELADKSAPIDPNTVLGHLRFTGKAEAVGGHLARFLEAGPAGGDAVLAHHFECLEQARQQREAVSFIVQSLPDLSGFRLNAPAFAEELFSRCAPLAASTGITTSEIAGEIEREILEGVVPHVFPTGLAGLDGHMGGGLHHGEMAVVGGQTGAGKSALMIQTAAACAEADRPVIYLSLEMPRRDVFNRLAASASGSPPTSQHFRKAQAHAAILPVTIHDNLSALPDICAAIQAAARRGKASLAVVDYLQLVEAPGDSRELALSETARRLKTLALSENIVVLTASQLNDDGRLRESRAIGHHADVVLAIEEDGICFRKFRRGAANHTISAHLRGSISRFAAS